MCYTWWKESCMRVWNRKTTTTNFLPRLHLINTEISLQWRVPLTVHVTASFRYLLLSEVSSIDPVIFFFTTPSSDPVIFFFTPSSDHAVIPKWIELPAAHQDIDRPSFSTMISKVTRATWTIVTRSTRGWSLVPFASSSLLLVFCWVHFPPILWTGTMLTMLAKNLVSVDLNLRKIWVLMVFSMLKDTRTTRTTSTRVGLWMWRPPVNTSSDLKNQGTLPIVPRLLPVVNQFQWNNQMWTQLSTGNPLRWPETTYWDGYWRCAAR